jgi:hypothetical protein
MNRVEAWRFDGQLTSPGLAVDDFQLHDVRAALQYREGVLFLSELQVGVPVPNEPRQRRGSLHGNARMELTPRGDFTASAQLQDFPLRALASHEGMLRGLGGRLTGSLDARAPIARIRDVAAWRANASAEVNQLAIRNLPPAAAAAQFNVNEGDLAAREFRLKIGSSEVNGNATISVLGEWPWRADAQMSTSNIPELLRELARLTDERTFTQASEVITAGTVRASAALSGALATPGTVAMSGHAMFENVTTAFTRAVAATPLRPFTIQRLDVDYRLESDRLEASRILAIVAGGTITGEVGAPLGDGNLNLSLRWEGLRVSELLEKALDGTGVSSGAITAAAPIDDLPNPSRWRLAANASLSEFTYGEATSTNLQTGPLTIENGLLAMPQFSARLAGEPVAGSLQLKLDGDRTLQSTFDLPRLAPPLLRSVPQLAPYAVQLEGVVGVSGNVSGTWRPLNLVAQGHLGGENLRIAGRSLDSIQFDFGVKRDHLALSSIESRLYGGRASGSANISLGDNLGGTANLSWSDVNVGRLLAGIPLGPVTVLGASDGEAELRIPNGALDDITQWSAKGDLAVEAVDVYAWHFRDMDRVKFSLKDSDFQAPGIRGLVDGSPIYASVSVGVAAPYAIRVHGSVQRTRIERLHAIPALEGLANRVGGEVDFSTQIQGTLSPVRLAANGSAIARAVRLDTYAMDRASFNYEYQPESLKASGIVAELYGGEVTGRVALALIDPAESSARLKWSRLNIGRLLDHAFDWQSLNGRTDGELDVRVPSGMRYDVSGWDAAVRLGVADLSVNEVSIASIAGSLSQQNRALKYDVKGRLLGGALDVSGSRRAEDPASGWALLGSIRASLQNVQLEDAARILIGPDLPTAVTGTLSMTAESRVQEGEWRWGGALRLGALEIQDRQISTGVDVRATGSDDVIRIDSVSGQIAGGALVGSGEWDRSGRRGRVFRFGLRGARIEELTSLALDRPDSPASGRLDIEVRVSPGALWRIQGTAAATRADVGGQSLSNARVPFDVTWHPLTGQMEARIGGALLSIAGGRMTWQVIVTYRNGWNLDADVRFSRVDFTAVTGSDYGRGQLSGALALSGRNLRSVNDLRGVLRADLQNAQASQIPLLSQIKNYVPGITSSATQFGDGQVEARLQRGVVHVDEFSVASSQLQIYITGRATLAGRLGLEATVATGDHFDSLRARSLLARFAMASVAPASLLVTANDFLSDRVIHLAIGGTVQRPAVRIQPFKSLREEAIRFFLRQATQGLVPIRAGASSSSAR